MGRGSFRIESEGGVKSVEAEMPLRCSFWINTFCISKISWIIMIGGNNGYIKKYHYEEEYLDTLARLITINFTRTRTSTNYIKCTADETTATEN